MSSKKLMTFISAVAVVALLSQPASEPNADIALATTNAIAVSASRDDTAPSPDFDGDGRVGFSDFLTFAEHFGTRQGDVGYDAQFDLDGDGETGFSDFIAFASQYGTTVGSPPPSGNPDLIVESPSVNDNTMTTGQSFALRATVRNQGNASSGSTTLRYYRSSDATISTDDVEVGTDGVSSLSAGGTSAESISLNGPSDAGAYYYGACVDNVSGESNAGNNCSSGVGVTVSTSGSPDLIVESPSVNDNTMTTGQSFTFGATVRNQGNGSSAATTLRYYRSSDATISTDDVEVGTDAVSALSAVGTSAESISLNAPSDAGTYYYGACVDAVSGESDTENNCSAAVTVTVGAPDLVVDAPAVSSSRPTAGASFTLSATVRNQGNGPSVATTLRWYLSTDATVSTSDTEVGADRVSTLSASRTSAESISLTAPSSAGTYYYGACVESVSDESDTGNNCSAAVTVTVGAPPAPDLVVDAPTVSNGSPTAGASFRLSATVRNQGNGPSVATTLRWYLSTDATVSTSDTEVGADRVSTLSASRTSAESISLTAPSSAGTYYYGACVESVSDETDTGNNCSAAVTVTVGAPPAPDLVVDAPTVSNGSPTAGASFRLSATVRNRGTGRSGLTTLRWYLSTDATVSTSDIEIGTDRVGILSASRTSSESITLPTPMSAGTYYYGACVESVSDESDTGNNCSAAVTVTVGAPDLVVGTPRANPSNPTAGASFYLSVTVENQGKGRAAGTILRFYRSTDETISASDTEVGSHAVPPLAVTQGGYVANTNPTAPSNAGTYFYGACVESVSDETDTGNNCSSAVTVTVGAAPAPDLVVDSPTVSNSSPTAGASFTLSATVHNQGSGTSAATTLRWYRSDDATVSTSDTEVGADRVGILSASHTSSESITLTAPSSAGAYYYGTCVESVSDETDTGNNCSPAVTVTVVAAPAPDLIVDSPTVSNNRKPTGGGYYFTLSATVRNQGSGTSAATTLRWYRSDDATVSTTDTEVGTDLVSILSASQTSFEAITLPAPSSAGTYYYGACVESVSDESDTGNNCSSAVAVTVAGTVPELVVYVYSPSISDFNPTVGASFRLTATVRNRGNGQSAATTLRFYRSTDGTISASDTEVGSHAVGGLAAFGTSDHSIDLTAPSSAGKYYYYACVESVSGESNTEINCSPAVHVIVVAPDLVVFAPSVINSSPTVGASFRLTVTVYNQGNDRPFAATTLRFYRSTDATISDSDTEVGSHAVGGLSAAGISDHSIDLTAPSSAGTYYYGACVESVSGETDTGNNCSPAVTVTVVAPDLVVEPPFVSDSSPTAGASFTLSAYVYNQGNGQSAATTLRFYLSTDGTISDSDTEVGSHAVGGLTAPGTSDHSIDLTAPSSAGTYYYGACVESVSDETDTGNNCSAAVTVTVTQGWKMYWTDAYTDKIQRSNLDGSDVEDLVTTELSSPYGIALDVAGGKMYWTDAGTGKIQRSNLDGSDVEDLVTTGLERPQGIALDVAGGKMYWTDATADRIQRSNLDGSGVEDLVNIRFNYPYGIALDVAGGKMYWTDATADKIQRSNLDGSGVEDLVTAGLDDPYGIVLDVAGGKMYWTDNGTDKIQRSNLNGSVVSDLVATGLSNPRGIALDAAGGKLYWTDKGTDKIQRSNLDGSGVEDLVTTGLEDPFGIALGLVPVVAGTD